MLLASPTDAWGWQRTTGMTLDCACVRACMLQPCLACTCMHRQSTDLVARLRACAPTHSWPLASLVPPWTLPPQLMQLPPPLAFNNREMAAIIEKLQTAVAKAQALQVRQYAALRRATVVVVVLHYHNIIGGLWSMAPRTSNQPLSATCV